MKGHPAPAPSRYRPGDSAAPATSRHAPRWGPGWHVDQASMCPGGPARLGPPVGSACPTHLEILDVFGGAELGQARCPHQRKEVQEEEAMAPQDGVGAFAVAPEPAERRQAGEAQVLRPLRITLHCLRHSVHAAPPFHLPQTTSTTAQEDWETCPLPGGPGSLASQISRCYSSSPAESRGRSHR